MTTVDSQYEPVMVDGGKITYTMRHMELAKARDLWPNRLDIPEEALVAWGERYQHGMWVNTRTSLLIGIDYVAGVVETKNSFYRNIDGALKQ